MSEPTRTCPPPTPRSELRKGDRISYQLEHMSAERQATIADIADGRITTTDAVTIPAGNAYVRRIDKGPSSNNLTKADIDLRRRFCEEVLELRRTRNWETRACVEFASGLPEFAELGGVGLSTFYKWRKTKPAGEPELARRSHEGEVGSPAVEGAAKPQPPDTPPPAAPEQTPPPIKKTSGKKLAPADIELRKLFVHTVNKLYDNTPRLTLAECFSRVCDEPEFKALATATISAYRQWRERFDLPVPNRSRKHAKRYPAWHPADPPLSGSSTSSNVSIPSISPPPEPEQTPVPEPDPKIQRAEAIRYAAVFVKAKMGTGMDPSEAVQEILDDTEWDRYGGPPTEDAILYRALDLIEEHGGDDALRHAILDTLAGAAPPPEDAQWDTPAPGFAGSDPAVMPHPDDIVADDLHAWAVAFQTFCHNVATVLGQVEADQAKLARIRATLEA